MTKNYKIDYSTNTVTVSKSFAKAAGIIGSAAFEEMKELRKLGMMIRIQETSWRKREAQRKWTYAQIERYLRNVENNDEYFAEFMTIRDAKGYASVWNWFRMTFPNYDKTPEIDSDHKIRVTPADYPSADYLMPDGHCQESA